MIKNRLKKCIDLIDDASYVCDVGTDHGYLACELIRTEKSYYVIASDIGKGPLMSAKQNVCKAGYEEKIGLVLSDGLKNISENENSDKLTAVIIAGMGGETIIDILVDSPEYAQKVQLVLQPMTKAYDLRKWLCENGYKFREEAVEDSGKIYTVISAVYTNEKYELEESLLYVGKLDFSLEISREYADKQIEKVQKIANGIKHSDEELSAKYQMLEKRMREIVYNECK
jgi:tRNA (adenine22-N1)-methyltransferase